MTDRRMVKVSDYCTWVAYYSRNARTDEEKQICREEIIRIVEGSKWTWGWSLWQSYRIIRFRQNGRPRTLHRFVTLSVARLHCSDPRTQGDGWFDGYDLMPGYTEPDKY